MQEPSRQWHYFIDAEGHLYHEGVEIDDPEVLHLFMKEMEPLPDGRYRVSCQGEECLVAAEDVPYVITDLKFEPRSIQLVFPGGYIEPLDPSTLYVGNLNVLYCEIRSHRVPARFNRRTYLEIAKRVSYDAASKSFYLKFDNHDYPIQGVK